MGRVSIRGPSALSAGLALLCVAAVGACAASPKGPRFGDMDSGPRPMDDGSPQDGDAESMCTPANTGFLLCTGVGLVEEDGCGGSMPVAACGDGTCANGACCPADGAPAPSAVLYADWTFPADRLNSVSFHVCLEAAPVTNYTFTLYNASADNTAFTLGLQTIAGVPSLILNRDGTVDPAEVTAEAPSTTVVNATTITLARGFAWADGECFKVSMTRGAASGTNDWFDVSLQRDGAAVQVLGAVRFPRSEAATPVTMNNNSGSAIYYGQFFALKSDIPRWDFTMQASANGAVATAVKVLYEQGFGNVKVDTAAHLIRVQTGGTSAPCTAPGSHVL